MSKVMFRGKLAFLSNFYPCEIEYEGITYPTTEHAYQAAKSADPAIRKAIARLDTPNKSKQAGKRVDMRPEFESIKLQVMEDICRIKFAKPDMKAALLATGNLELVERNVWRDDFWGVCTDKGKNHLGIILMKIREDLKKDIPE